MVALQETKCSQEAFPESALTSLGYEIAHMGSGPRAGVCLLSRIGLDDAQFGFGGSPASPFDEPRLVAATVGGVRVVTVYAPNGKRVGTPQWRVKLAWFELLKIELELELASCAAAGIELVVVGDLNVCPTLDDVYDPAKKGSRNLVSPRERAALRAIIDLGFTDLARLLHGAQASYTWFSYMDGQFQNDRGYRLDLALATRGISTATRRCEALRSWRDPDLHERPSDHAPLLVVCGV